MRCPMVAFRASTGEVNARSEAPISAKRTVLIIVFLLLEVFLFGSKLKNSAQSPEYDDLIPNSSEACTYNAAVLIASHVIVRRSNSRLKQDTSVGIPPPRRREIAFKRDALMHLVGALDPVNRFVAITIGARHELAHFVLPERRALHLAMRQVDLLSDGELVRHAIFLLLK